MAEKNGHTDKPGLHSAGLRIKRQMWDRDLEVRVGEGGRADRGRRSK